MLKKLIAIILTITACILPASAYAAGSFPMYHAEGRSVERQATVSHGKSYVSEYQNAAPLAKYEDSGTDLTDGIYSPILDYNGTDWIGADGWVGFEAVDKSAGYSVSVTLDLGYAAREIGQILIRTLTDPTVKGTKPSITAYASVDGITYFDVGVLTAPNEEFTRVEMVINKLVPHETFSARYIRIVFEQVGDKALLTDEIHIAAYGELERIGENGGDSEGRTYDFSTGYAVPTGVLADFSKAVPGAAAPTDADFDGDGNTFYIGNGVGKSVKVINDFMSIERKYYSHYTNDIKYIVIHNTGANQSYADAEMMHNYLLYKDDNSTSAWHYTVDDNVIYHGLKDCTVGWHTASNYNFYSIGIEMCVNGAPVGPGGNNDPITSGAEYEAWYKNKFIPTIQNTAVLTAELLVRYNLTPDKVWQHTDTYYYQAKQCPYYLRLDKDKNLVHDGTGWVYFMSLVNTYYDAMTKNGERTVSKTYSPSDTLPDYVFDTDGKVYLVTDNPKKQASFVSGDANYNGKLDANDTELIKKIVLLEDGSRGYPDYDGDGRITMGDYLGVKRKIAD